MRVLHVGRQLQSRGITAERIACLQIGNIATLEIITKSHNHKTFFVWTLKGQTLLFWYYSGPYYATITFPKMD